MTSLQQYLNHFIYAKTIDHRFIEEVKKIPFTTIKQKQLNNIRHEYQMSAKDMQRNRAYRYKEGFKITRNMANPEEAYKNLSFITDAGPFYLNMNAFMTTIEMLGNEQQVQHWRNLALNGKIIGAYAQTQVGHGSDVKSLQTEAVYDEKRQVWVLNSPKVTSTKFWVGLLGNFGTHVVLQARAVVKGKFIGIQTFVIEIRNENLELLPNVEAFDDGPKLGLDVIDNGSVIFKNKAIPRNGMLMKYVSVNPDGTVTGLENKSAIKYGYGSMLNLRVQLTFGFAMDFNVLPQHWIHNVNKQLGTEMQQVNRKFITDKLCIGLGIILSNSEVLRMFQQYTKQLTQKNYSKADKLLATVHIISSTFKAVSGRLGIDSMAQTLSNFELTHFRTSKIPHRFTLSIPGATFQGDNTVLLQQTSKFLLFKINLDKDFSTINKKFKSSSREDAINALEYVITKELKTIKDRIDSLVQKGCPFKTIWNQKQQVSLVRVSQVWGYMTLLKLLTPVMANIKEYSQFFDKVSQGFTHNLLKRVHEVEAEGFEVEWIDTWRQFSEIEFRSMAEIGMPIEEQADNMNLVARQEGRWLHAKL